MGEKITQSQESVHLVARLESSRIVRPGAPVSPKSIFSDPIWNMAALVTTPGVKKRSKVWDFSSLPCFPYGFALSLAEYAYARIYTPVTTHEREGGWLTVRNELFGLADFARFCESAGLQGFDEVDTPLCYEYLQLIQFSIDGVALKSKARVKTVIGYIYRLWEYSSAISNPMPSMPFGKPFKKLFKAGSGRGGTPENETPVIPEPVYAALMAAALDYALIYSPIILGTWNKLQSCWVKEIAPSDLSASGKKKRMTKAESVLIVDKATWLANDWSTRGTVYSELQQLRRACIIVVLAFSGIRLSELLSLEAGCYVIDECEDGRARYYINTLLHKHRQKGSRDTWVVIDEVVEAIKVLEDLTARARTESGENRLMLTDGSNQFFCVHRSYVGVEMNELTNEAIAYQIHEFQNHCNTKLNRPPIPEWTDENGVTAPWQINARQFRRTLARYIVRQPFGVIAGMLQYKHVGVAAFEGYAGSEPEWNQLLEQEKVLASVDILDELAMDLSNGELAGEFGLKLRDEFAGEFRGRAEDFPPSQIAKWLVSRHKILFVGKFNFCFFDSRKALCTKGSNSEVPILNFCEPETCSNACVGKRHRSRWDAQLRQAEELVANPKASEGQRILLQREVERLRAVVINCGK